MLSFFRPRLLQTLRGYSRADFFADVIAGVTVGIIALALSMALGIASDRTPGVGIVTAIIAGFLNALFSGSKVQIGGPTAAFIPVVVGVAQTYGVDGLIVCTLLAGVILILMGISRLGVMIKYIPMPVIAGFTAGIAVYIFSTQVRDFLGLRIAEKIPADFIGKVHVLATHIGTIDWTSTAVAMGSLLVIKFWPAKLARRVPGTIVAVILGTIAVALLRLPVETIGSRFGIDAIPRSLPLPHWPQFDWSQLGGLVRPAFTIALLASIESLLCAVVADGMTEDKHDSNTELCAQGAANIGSALFGGLPATGALARTAANIRSGARSPVAGITHSLTILTVVLVAAPLAGYIPLPVLSAVLVVVALNMGEWHHFARLRHWPRSDVVVYLLTFVLTIFTDITIAVEVGMVLASFLFIRRVAETTKLTSVDERDLDYDPEHSLRGKIVPAGVAAFQMQGAFMFGAADRLESILARREQRPRVIVLGMKRVLALDATGLHALEEFQHDIERRGSHLVIAGVHTQPFMTLSKGGFVEQLGQENFCADMDSALARAAQLAA